MDLLKICIIGVVLAATLMLASATFGLLMGVVSNVSGMSQGYELRLNCALYPNTIDCQVLD